jgi:hypothetical protein
MLPNYVPMRKGVKEAAGLMALICRLSRGQAAF